MKQGYFHRVTVQTPTKFWINNPTREQADWAIEAGALGCTNNPSYTWKMISHSDRRGICQSPFRRDCQGNYGR